MPGVGGIWEDSIGLTVVFWHFLCFDKRPSGEHACSEIVENKDFDMPGALRGRHDSTMSIEDRLPSLYLAALFEAC